MAKTRAGVPIHHDLVDVSNYFQSINYLRSMIRQIKMEDTFDPPTWPPDKREAFEKSALGKFKQYKSKNQQRVRTVRCL